MLTFVDNFDGATLDESRWVTCYWWDRNGCTNLGNANLQWYLPTGVHVGDGVLHLTAKEAETAASDNNTYHYTSGMVTTGRDVAETSTPPRFAFQYGYLEVRVQAPAGAGLWPAVWLLPITHDSKPEIDVMEMQGDEPTINAVHLHFRRRSGESDSVGFSWEGSDLTKGFHTYAIDWRPDSLTWYVDDEPIWEVTERVPQEPLYLLINLAVGGEYVGRPDEATEFPATFLVDWVRIWQ